MALLPAWPPRHCPGQPPEAADRADVRGPVTSCRRRRPVSSSELGLSTEGWLGGTGPLPGATVPPESTAAEPAEHLPGSSGTRHLPSPAEEHSGC